MAKSRSVSHKSANLNKSIDTTLAIRVTQAEDKIQTIEIANQPTSQPANKRAYRTDEQPLVERKSIDESQNHRIVLMTERPTNRILVRVCVRVYRIRIIPTASVFQ